ncbi:MAG: HAMP domain-containing sensor histidine kinase [Chloroflexota bacterium]|nr:HAMP domain-containing histidine kinase [Chloroflexota bacterium]
MKPKFQLGKINFSRFFYSMRFRLSLWYLAVLALALLFFGITIYSIEENTLSATIDGELNAAASQLSKFSSFQNDQFQLPAQVTNAIQQLSDLKLPELALGDLQNFPGVKSVLSGRFIILLVDTQGQVTQQFGVLSPKEINRLKTLASQWQGKTEPTITVLEFGDHPAQVGEKNNSYRIEFYPVKGSKSSNSGTLIVGLWWEGAATLQNLAWTLLVVGLVTLVLTAGGGYWLASRAIRPINKITRIAQSINESDLSRRINLKSRDELGELAATFDRMLDRLENAFERQRQFTADASHELRTPLTIINLEVDRLAQRRGTMEEYERVLSIIQAENDYMTRLVTDLLTVARAESGQVNFKPEGLDLSEVALEVVERLAPLARQNQIKLVTGELPELEISGDRLYLTRMLANLVENGIKYTASYGTRVAIETGLSQVENRAWAWVRIKDDGPGIASQDLPHLFHRFYQVDKARGANPPPEKPTPNQTEESLRGSGLGLSIVQGIAELHHGKVKVESEPNQGSTFEVWLPTKSG